MNCLMKGSRENNMKDRAVDDGGSVNLEMTVKPAPAPGSKKWCVAKVGTSAASLQANIDYACSNGVDCKPIQAGGTCFAPDTLHSHASYAMNAYYHSHGRHDFNCYFVGTGIITSSDPSYSSCSYLA